jgi:cytoskeletal protein CcmA (bactofilin family)
VTTIGESMRIDGTLISKEDVLLSGEFKGKLETDGRITLGPSSRVEATIKAHDATIAGTVTGNVESSGRLVLQKGANLIGDVKTAGIVIEDGAYFKGGIDIARATSTPAGVAGGS